MEYYLRISTDDILISVTTWMTLKTLGKSKKPVTIRPHAIQCR